MAIAIRGGSPLVVAASPGQPSGTLTTTRQPQAGDVLLIIHCNDFYALSNMPTPTVGGSTTGVTAVPSGSADAGTNQAHINTYTYVVGSTGDLTVAVSETGSADEDKALIVYVLSGVDTSTPTDGAGGNFATSASQVAPSVSPSSADAYLICHVNTGTGAAGGAFTPPGGMAEQYDQIVASGMGISGAVVQLGTSGATGTKTFTNASSTPYAAVSVAMKTAAAGGGPVVEVGLDVYAWWPGDGPGGAERFVADPTAYDTGAPATTTFSIAGDAASVSTAVGVLTALLALSGTAASTSSAAGAVTLTGALTGAAASTSAATGALARVTPIAGTAASTSSATAAVGQLTPIAGVAASTSAATGDLTRVTPIAGTAASTSAATGDLTITSGPQTFSIAGTATSTTTATGALTLRGALTGAAASSSSATGALTLRIVITAAAASTSSATGSLGVRTSITASAASVSAAVGGLTVAGPIAPGTVRPFATATARPTSPAGTARPFTIATPRPP